MSRDTKQEILDVSKQLFNERGFNSVTTRDIAEALGISKGNLTYYFKKKEDIIEALVAEGPKDAMPEPAETLEELDAYFHHVQQVVEDNAFYFWHHAQLSQVSPSIHDLQAKTLVRNKAILGQSLQALVSTGYMASEEYEGQHEKAADSLMLASIYWIPFCELKGDSAHEGFVDQAWSILYPLLTEAGRKALQDVRDFA